MQYRRWDTCINRLFGAFGTEGEALIHAGNLIREHGNAPADGLAPGCFRCQVVQRRTRHSA